MPKKVTTLKTAIGVVVDESDSMTGRAGETRSAFNEYFDNIEKEDPTATVTVATFSDVGVEDRVRFVCRNTSVKDMPYLDDKNYRPRGMTPLFDSVGKVVSTLSDEKADRYLVVILSDGGENSSKEYNKAAIQELIRSKEKTDKWTFVFLGAGIDAWQGAQSVGISTPGTVFGYSGAKGTTSDTMRHVSSSTTAYLASPKTSVEDFELGDSKLWTPKQEKTTS